jgi:hypothetical protein
MERTEFYREKISVDSRRFELFPDYVVVSGYAAFQSKFKLILPLAQLDPNLRQVGVASVVAEREIVQLARTSCVT